MGCRSDHAHAPFAPRLLALALIAALAPAGAQAGLPGGARPDLSFGDGCGYVTLEVSGQSTIAYAATATSEGIVVAGQAFPNGTEPGHSSRPPSRGTRRTGSW
jgi:hypothetical protein